MEKIKTFIQQQPKWILAVFALVLLQTAVILALAFQPKEEYQVNLVPVKLQKDSIDMFAMKSELQNLDVSVHRLAKFLSDKQVQIPEIEKLEADSLGSRVYLAKNTQRYSKILADLQAKMLDIPTGLPTAGYVSSNFGMRVNPIPKPESSLAHASEEEEQEEKMVSVPIPKAAGGTDSLKVSPKTQFETAKKPQPKKASVQMQFHKGVDIAAPQGTAVKAAAQGTVIFAGQKSGYGNCVIVSHANGIATLYGHLYQILVKAGDRVKSGQDIASVGNTGRSTGPHLHYEVQKNGTPVNPKLFLSL